jgi:hypothetical protein
MSVSMALHGPGPVGMMLMEEEESPGGLKAFL